ncbi:dorsal-ventral patterning tolloid-like protein 1 isoform X1 [Haliotis asinina]|uniref:dorsal-ventral patterning tolloid-like protein 1 isoform X1 n=1 Tax=Haliotis asinina TaxID=109174 RepID=UPI00353192EF
MYRFENNFVVWTYILLICLSIGYVSAESCDVIVSSRHGNAKNGTFRSPKSKITGNYPSNSHCIYKFIGWSTERVKIRFTFFDLQGRAPACDHDYLDIYTQIKSERETLNLLDAQLAGRFCGDLLGSLQNLIVSSKNFIVLSFYTDATKEHKGFTGYYEFFDASVYDIGTEAPPAMCGYTIRSENRKTGFIMSPTFPGMYADNMFCYYKLQGKAGERIKLHFIEFSLYHGEEYCPYDYVKIYDGYTNDAPVIGTFCGNYDNTTVLYSSGEALHIEFLTSQGRVLFDKQPLENSGDFTVPRKGFNITYKFSDQIVKLDFILPDAEHLIGTECDQRIMSKQETNGTIKSPNYPGSFPQNITCRYYLDGLMDRQHLEKARILFFDFDIPGNMPYCALGYVGLNEDSRLKDGTVKEKFCGTLRPPPLTSQGPRLVLTLDTRGAVQGGRFMAKYKFITDYSIPGTQISEDYAIPGTPISEGQCKFLYDDTSGPSGTFNTPRHPGNYPTDLTCEYIFRPGHDVIVLISFDSFDLDARQPNQLGCLGRDYLEILEEGHTKNNFSLVERHCGEIAPGPYTSSRVVKIVFHSNKSITKMGFKARYYFQTKEEIYGKCGEHVINSQGSGGIIKSPDYPRKYKSRTFCQWTVRASKPTNKILIETATFQLEGMMKQTGCQNSVMRIYGDVNSVQPVEVLCGSMNSKVAFLSTGDTFRITFVTSFRSLGAKGFKLSWTEVSEDETCFGFKCAKNNYCISSELKCNDLPNCGRSDESDETAECPTTAGVQILHIAIGTSISSFFCIILLICGFYHRRKFRSERTPPDHDHVEVRYVSAPTGCNTTDRLLMEEKTQESPRCQKVSMV